MFSNFRILLISTIISTFSFADVFMTEITDPQNSSSAGRYVELYNNGDSDVVLGDGSAGSWALQRWTNADALDDPQSPKYLEGTITTGGFFIVCNNANKFAATWPGLTCDDDIGTGGPADSNGDDNMALLDASGAVVDMFGLPGEDGTNTSHEFEDGRAERAADCTTAQNTYSDACWNTWCDDDEGCEQHGRGQGLPVGHMPHHLFEALLLGGDHRHREHRVVHGAEVGAHVPRGHALVGHVHVVVLLAWYRENQFRTRSLKLDFWYNFD